MAKRDFYEVLAVPRTANSEEITRAFKKLALKYHPDRNPDDRKGAEERFKEAAEAYQVLRDPEKRAIYDRYGHEGLSGQPSPGFADVGFDQIVRQFFGDFDDFFGFESIFGNRSGRNARRGADIEYNLTIDLEEAVFGTKKVIEITRHEMCPHCRGTGCAPGTQPENCPTCRGTGAVQRTTGFFAIRTSCPRCRGQGKVIASPCKRCDGVGRAPRSIPVEIVIPAGVPNGATLRLSGQGELGDNNAPRGDLFCNIYVREHEFFERHGDDLICRMPITYTQAALGCNVEVPTLEGKKITLHIKAGTQNGDVYRLKSHGAPRLRSSGRGDQLVQVYVEVPKRLSPRQEQLLRELAKLEDVDVPPQRKSFLEKLKKYFTSGHRIEPSSKESAKN